MARIWTTRTIRLTHIKTAQQLPVFNAGMDTKRRTEGARCAALELIDLLQQAHFAARRLEAYGPVEREKRLVDQIHALRIAAEHLRPA